MNYIQRSVQELVEKYSTSDPYEIAHALGIDIEEHPFSRIEGMILEIAGKATIVLNSHLDECTKRIVLAHELGHQRLSPHGAGYFFITENTLMESRIEYEANKFAVELLTWSAEPEIGETLEEFAARLGIPEEMMEYKIIG